MKRLLALALAALAVLPTAAVADVTDGSFALVDRPSGFGALPFDGASSSNTSDHSISANGCYVVFASDNDDLLPSDDDAFANIYRQDRCTPGHPVSLVSAASDGTPANGISFRPSISASGRYVAFGTAAHNLDPAVIDSGTTVLVKDMSTGAVEVANRADGGSGAIAPQTFDFVISGDGRHVAFLVFGAIDAANVDGVAGELDTYVRFLDTARTYMASLTSGNAHAGGVDSTSSLGVSYDGTSVAFVTPNQLVAGDTDQGSDAYLVRAYTGSSPSVQLASYEVGNLAGSDFADRVALSSNGKHIAWSNDRVWWTICDPACGPDAQADGSTGGFTRFTSLSFANGPNGTTAPTHVFWSNERSLSGADTNNAQDVYARDITAGGSAITLLTTGAYARGATGGTATDDASSLVVFDSPSPDLPGTDGTRSQTFVRTGGQTTNISQPEGDPRRSEVGSSSAQTIHAVSADGRFVGFLTFAPYLGAQTVDGSPRAQAYVRDVVAGTNTPVSFAADGSPANGSVAVPSIDAAGDRVVFESSATNLSPDVTSGARRHVYLHDLRTGATTLLDRNPAGAPLAQGAEGPQISADGTKVVFHSATNELKPGTSGLHVYLLDLATGQFTLVDKTQGGTPGNGNAFFSDIGGDRVAFLSDATNLGGNTVGPPDRDAYVKDLRTGVVSWASIPEDGSSGKSAVFDVSLSGDGRRVAFSNNKAGFGYGADDNSHIFVRDLDGAKTTFVSGGTGTGGGTGQFGSSLSMDGTHVAFWEFLPNTVGRFKAYVRDLSGGGLREVAPNARLGALRPSLNGNGTCVEFQSRSPDLVTPSFGPDYFHIYLAAMGANCPAGSPQGPSDTTPPAISKLRVTNKRFAVANKRTVAVARKRKKVKRGTAFKFRLSEAARTTITIARKAAGRRKGKRCVKPRKGLKKRCTRYLTAMKVTRSKTKRGGNTIAFTGRVGKKKLTPGAYRATLVATDAAGNKSKPARVSFTVVRG